MPTTIDFLIFGMEAAIRLGSEVIDVYQEEIKDRDVILPLAESTGAFSYDGALTFFRKEGNLFVEEGGLYHGLWKKIGSQGDASMGVQDELRRAAAYVEGLLAKAKKEHPVDEEAFYRGMAGYYAVAQWKKEDPDRPRRSLQRIAGTIFEIGLDYVKTDASFLDADSKSQRIVRSILLALEPIDFSEQKADILLVDLFNSSMAVFHNNLDMIIEDDRLSLLLGEIGETLKKEVGAIDNIAQLMTLERIGRDVLPGIVKASAGIVLDNTELFLGGRDSQRKRFSAAVLKATLKAAKTNPTVFSGKTLVDIYRSALTAVGQNANLLLGDGKEEQFVANLFTSLATTLADRNPSRLFEMDVLKEVIAVGLEAASNNAHLLVSPEEPEEQLLADALRRVLLAFSDDFTENDNFSAIASRLFSRNNLVQIISICFDEVSRNPEALLRSVGDDDARSVLAQVIGSVTAAVGSDPVLLLNGREMTRMLEIAFEAFSRNPDRLIDLTTVSPKTNLLYSVIADILASVRENKERGGRDLLTGAWLLAALDSVLSSVSKNIEAFRKNEHIVMKTLNGLLELASGSHADLMDAENLVAILRVVLRAVLKDSSLLSDPNRFKALVETILSNMT